MRKQLKSTALLALIWAIAALLILSAATYAWFSFSPYVNATPMSGLIGGGDGSLLISNRYDGEYGVQCDLLLTYSSPTLQPISTATLSNFYVAGDQTASGIVTRFYPLTADVDTVSMHGTVYLKSEDSAHDVYFDRLKTSFGEDIQALASMRLGLLITVRGSTTTHIFKLDDLYDTSSAVRQRTVMGSDDIVVASADASGTPTYYPDPAVSMSEYFIQGSAERLQAGSKAICSIPAGEIATVEYWLYLEGCDDHCINAVQLRDVALQMAFDGIIHQTAANP